MIFGCPKPAYFACFICLALLPPAYADIVIVSTVKELLATSGPDQADDLTVCVRNGTYELDRPILVDGNRVTYKSLSNDRERVVIKGKGYKGGVGSIFSIRGSRIYIRGLSLGEVSHHVIQIHGEDNADYIFLKDLRLYDSREQLLKGSYDAKKAPENHTDYGLIENCIFEFMAGFAFQTYTGGIDIHHGENWVVKNNTFKNIRIRGNGLTEGAIHFWNNSKNTLISGNTILNCDRGITLGLDNTLHIAATIVNNRIHTIMDTGIYLCNARDVAVKDNTIFIDSAYPNAIEYRFFMSRDITINNNRTNRRIRSRDGGQAVLSGNRINESRTWRVNLTANTLEPLLK